MSDECQVQTDMGSFAPAGKLMEAIGIETIGGTFTPLLRKGSTVPATWSQPFSTAEDNQSRIKLRLFRGNTRRTRSAVALGTFTISGIAPMPRGTPKIIVELTADGTGLWLRAHDQLGKSGLTVLRTSS